MQARGMALQLELALACGSSSTASSASSAPAPSSLRTSPPSTGRSTGRASTSSSRRSAPRGIAENEQSFPLVTWVHPTSASASSSSPCDTRAWATPRANDPEKRGHFDATDPRTGLAGQVVTWATPTANGQLAASIPALLNEAARLHPRGQWTLGTEIAAWATPSSRDYKDTPGMATEGVNPDGTARHRLDQLPRHAYAWTGVTASSPEATTGPSDSSRPKPRRAGLNPRFGLWLMGFPVGWLDSAPSATPSSRRSRKSSDSAW